MKKLLLTLLTFLIAVNVAYPQLAIYVQKASIDAAQYTILPDLTP